VSNDDDDDDDDDDDEDNWHVEANGVRVGTNDRPVVPLMAVMSIINEKESLMVASKRVLDEDHCQW